MWHNVTRFFYKTLILQDLDQNFQGIENSAVFIDPGVAQPAFAFLKAITAVLEKMKNFLAFLKEQEIWAGLKHPEFEIYLVGATKVDLTNKNESAGLSTGD